MTDSIAAIETVGLTKRYSTINAVDCLDLTVKQGEIYGFLGANGAGKSTTIGLLLDYFRPTAGEIRILGRDPIADLPAVHDRLGVLPDRFGLYSELSGRQHVAFVVETKNANDDPDTLLSRVGLTSTKDRQAGVYSQGMQQRLALAMAIVGEPELLILDEPFTGLDPHGVRRVREIVREENDRGATVFFSSHVLEQVGLICDRVGIIHTGRLVAEGAPDDLRRQTGVSSDSSMEDVFIAVTDATEQGTAR